MTSWLPHITHRENTFSDDHCNELLSLVRPKLRNFANQPYDKVSALIITFPGTEIIGRTHFGEGPGHRVIRLRFEKQHAFVSTERATRLPHQRQPVADEYTFLLHQNNEAWCIKSEQQTRKLVPYDCALQAMQTIQDSPAFQRVLKRFDNHAYATRLADRPTPKRAARPRAQGLLKRLFRRSIPPDPHPPERQLKFTLDQWLPPGSYRFGDLFFDGRNMADNEINISSPAMAWTIEFWEMPGPRYVHWHFHGALARCVYDPSSQRILTWQSFKV